MRLLRRGRWGRRSRGLLVEVLVVHPLEELVRRARSARISVIGSHVAHASTAVDMAAGVAAHASFLAAGVATHAWFLAANRE